MRTLSIFIFAVLVSCGGPAQETASPTLAQDEVVDINAEIGAAVADFKKAYESRSLESIAQLYESGLDVTLVYQGKLFPGTSQVQAYVATRLENATQLRMLVGDLRVRSLGKGTAMASFNVEITIGDDSVSVTEKGLSTVVYRKEADKWVIALEHFSYPVVR